MASICINFTFLPFHKSLQENIEMGDIDKEIRLAKSLVSSAGPVNIMIIHHIFISSDRSSYSDDVLVYIQLGSQPLFEILSIYAFL